MLKSKSLGQQTQALIWREATKLIAEHGFEAMNLRQLAKRVGIQPGSLYNHIAGKQELLYSLLRAIMEELLEKLQTALSEANGPVAKLKAMVRFHIETHIDRRQEVFIGNMELRSLTASQYAKVVALRSRYEQYLHDILETGTKEGVFALAHPKVATFGMISMLTGVCQWFRPDGRLTRDELVEIYTQLALRLAGVNSTVMRGVALPAGQNGHRRRGSGSKIVHGSTG